LKDEYQLLEVIDKLQDNNIFPRRYFYPSLDTVECLNTNTCTNNKETKPSIGIACPVSRDIAKRILCLPIYAELSIKEQEKIISVVRDTIKLKR